MIVGVPKETFPGERRVALIPASIPTLAKAGCEVLVEAGAGETAFYPDALYVERGAKIATSRSEVFGAEVILQVLGYGANDKNEDADLQFLRRDQALIGFLRPLGNPRAVEEIALPARSPSPSNSCRASRGRRAWTRSL